MKQMKNEAIQKINKIGKISSVIALIGKILVGIGIALLLIGAVVCFLMPKDFLKISLAEEMTMELDFSSLGIEMTDAELTDVRENLKMELAGEEPEFTEVDVNANKMVMKGSFEQYAFIMRDIAGMLVLALITLIMTFITLIFVGNLCKAFRDCQSPFEADVIKKMQHLAYALIPWTIVAAISNSISDSIMHHKFSLNFTLDLGVVLIVMVVFVLVYIFKYGAVLQQESDETL